MGFAVISKVGIEFNCELNEEIVMKVRQVLDETETKAYHFMASEDYIAFELWGNKSVDYDCLDEIKEELKEYIVEIVANEYTESEDGYYYNYEEDQENVESD